MAAYFVRRILLAVPTFLGITIAIFAVVNLVPGGPVERQLARLRMSTVDGGGGAFGTTGEIPDDAVQQLTHFYGFDRPVYTRYALWLWNLLHWDLGRSYIYQDPVWEVIKPRLFVSIFLGLCGFSLSYLLSIPLGIWKAVRHGTKFDMASSFFVFLIYSIPSWAIGAGLLVFFGGGSFWNVFPLGGFRPDDWDYLNFVEKVGAQIHYMFLPVLCYSLAQFATMTFVTKNSVLENLQQDYVRTAFAKGLAPKRVVLGHVLRNSLIPVVSGLGRVFSVILTGSFLIEKVFNINGIGFLGVTSVVQRDYPVALGILVVASVFLMAGNIVSDFLYAAIDSRIRFH